MAMITYEEVQSLQQEILDKDLPVRPMGFDKGEVDNFLDAISDKLTLVLEYMDYQRQKELRQNAAQPAAQPAEQQPVQQQAAPQQTTASAAATASSLE